MRIRIGTRRVLLLTCTGCGRHLPGEEFECYPRKPGEAAYLDRRCRRFCRWRHLERTPREIPA